MLEPSRRISLKDMSGEARALQRGARRSTRSGCEVTSEDVHNAAESASGRSPVWEKRFQQTILVHVSDDDSLHLSDLRAACTVRVSQSSAASRNVTSSESRSLSGSDEAVADSSVCPDSVSSKRRCHPCDGNASDMKASGPDPAAEKPQWQHLEDDTSDEDQEELPYDREPHSYDMHHGVSLTNVLQTVDNHSRDGGISHGDDPSPTAGPEAGPRFLLRYFSQEELLNCDRLIEDETLPEVSLLESVDETVLSRDADSPRTSPGDLGAKPQANLAFISASETSVSMEAAPLRNSNTADLLILSGSRGRPDCQDLSSSSCAVNAVSSKAAEDEEGDEEEGAVQSCIGSTPDLGKTRAQSTRTPSSGEVKYGQGQVHYPRPDFSKVESKVKIPKVKGPAKPGVDKTQMTRGIEGKSPAFCTADTISRVLEDTVWSCAVRDEEKLSRLDKHLQAEYDRLLTKYAEDDNLIIQRGTSYQVCSESQLSAGRRETAETLDITHQEGQSSASPPSRQSSAAGLNEQGSGEVWRAELTSQTEGQSLTTELSDIINQFMEKVEELNTNISDMTVEEQRMVFKSMVEAQDQLERTYMSKKEEHQALEMQSYMGLYKNMGQFDPDRQVEGQIFRLGMQLEVIKEQIDRNASHELSPALPPPATSPSSLRGLITTSACQPILHEESVVSICTRGHLSAEEEEHLSAEEEEHLSAEDEEYFKTIDAEPPRATTPHHTYLSGQSSPSSAEDEEASVNMAGVEHDHEDFLARLVESSFQLHQRTPCRPPGKGCHLQDTPKPYAKKTQRYVRPETDSGLGASDLSRPPTGLSHTHHNAESWASFDDVSSTISVNTSDNEASLSNLQMTVSMTTLAGWPKMGESEPGHLNNGVQDIQWNYTLQNAPVRLHFMAETPLCGEEGATLPSAQLQEMCPGPQLRSAAAWRPPVDEVSARHHHSPSSCPNSEVIRVLQYEVSCLKRALEDNLGYLTQSSQMYTQEKTLGCQPRPRQQHRPAASRFPNIDLIHKKVEDWMSSDIELTCTHPGSDSGESDIPPPACFHPAHRDSYICSRSPSHRRPPDPRRSSMDGTFHPCTDSLESLSMDMVQSRHGNHQSASARSTNHSSRASAGSTNHSTDAGFGLTNHRKRGNRSNEYRLPGDSGCPLPHPLHKPVLQINYGSCYSFSSFFTAQQSEPGMSSRSHSIQSDSALLPNNNYVQWASPLHTSPYWTGGKAQTHRHHKDAMINRTLDEALKAVLLLKQTTQRIADSLTPHLAKDRLDRK